LVADAGDRIRFVTPGLAAALLPARALRGAPVSAVLRQVADHERLAVDGFRRSGNLAVAAWRAPLGAGHGSLYVGIDTAARPATERAAVAALGTMLTARDGPMRVLARALACATLAVTREQALATAKAILVKHAASDADSVAAGLVALESVVALATAPDANLTTQPHNADAYAGSSDKLSGMGDLLDAALMLQIADCIDVIEAAAAATAVRAAVAGGSAQPPSIHGQSPALRAQLILSWNHACRLIGLATVADRSLGAVHEAVQRVNEAVACVARTSEALAAPDTKADTARPADPAPMSINALRKVQALRAH
jgi:hypothetical protein